MKLENCCRPDKTSKTIKKKSEKKIILKTARTKNSFLMTKTSKFFRRLHKSFCHKNSSFLHQQSLIHPFTLLHEPLLASYELNSELLKIAEIFASNFERMKQKYTNEEKVDLLLSLNEKNMTSKFLELGGKWLEFGNLIEKHNYEELVMKMCESIFNPVWKHRQIQERKKVKLHVEREGEEKYDFNLQSEKEFNGSDQEMRISEYEIKKDSFVEDLLWGSSEKGESVNFFEMEN